MTGRKPRFWLVTVLIAVVALLWATNQPASVLADDPDLGSDPVRKSPEGAPAVSLPPLENPDVPLAWNLTENFDVVTPAGWTATNNSSPVGTIGWFQGNDTVFPAQTGAPTAYAGVNFNSGSGLATISNWLVSPLLTINNGDTWSFWTRTIDAPTFPDRLQVRISTGGTCSPGTGATSVGDFTTLLLDINPTYTTTGYPNTWTNFTGTISGLGGASSGCFAFRYFVENAGPSGSNSDYIGVDTLVLAAGGGGPTATPTATTVAATPTATATPPTGGTQFYGVDLRAAPDVFFQSNTAALEPITPVGTIPAGQNYFAGDFIGNDSSALVAIDDATNQMVSINTTTGAITPIGTSTNGAAETWTGMTYSCVSGVTYGVAGDGVAPSNLYTLNPATGAATLVGPMGAGIPLMIDIAAHPTTGVLYGIDISTDSLYTINSATGAATLVGPTGVNGNFAQGMDFDNSTGTLYYVGYIGGGVNQFSSINLATGAATTVGSFTNREVDSLAFVPPCPGGPTATPTNTPPPTTPTATATPGTGNRFCSTTPITIPDNLPGGATGTVNVPSSGTISDMNVVVTGTHTWVGDITLNIANGTTNVTFYDRPGVPASTFGCSGDNLPGVIADDEGVDGSFENSCQNATPAYTPGGSYTNNNPLTAFDGQDTSGTWTLTASDGAGGDTGTIDSWCVEFTTGTGPTATPTVPAQVPDINVTPGSVSETHSSPPQTTNQILTIQNVGTGTLNWTIAEDDTATTPVEDITDKVVPAPQDLRFAAANDSVVQTRFLQSGAMAPSNGTINLVLDDGTNENGLGLTAGGQFIWFNRFTPAPTDFPFTLTEIQFYTGSDSLCAPTDAVDFYVYQDADGNPANGATHIGSLTGQTLGTLDQFNTYPTNINVTGPGDVLILAVNRGCAAAGQFPASLDQTASQVRSWIGFGGTPGNPPTLPATTMGTADSFGFPGNWLIRGVGEQGGGGACSAPTDIPWLTVSPTNGSTAGGGSTPVTLTFNSATLAQGTYTGTLCVESNDPDEELVTVPVTLNVGPPTAIDLSTFTAPVSGFNPADLAAAGLLLLAGAVLIFRRK